HALDLAAVGDVRLPNHAARMLVLDRLQHLERLIAALQIVDDDRSAALREAPRRRRYAAARARDQNDFALKRTARALFHGLVHWMGMSINALTGSRFQERNADSET